MKDTSSSVKTICSPDAVICAKIKRYSEMASIWNIHTHKNVILLLNKKKKGVYRHVIYLKMTPFVVLDHRLAIAARIFGMQRVQRTLRRFETLDFVFLLHHGHQKATHQFHTALFQFIRLGTILILIGDFFVRHRQAPHSQNAVDIVTDLEKRRIFCKKKMIIKIKSKHPKIDQMFVLFINSTFNDHSSNWSKIVVAPSNEINRNQFDTINIFSVRLLSSRTCTCNTQHDSLKWNDCETQSVNGRHSPRHRNW